MATVVIEQEKTELSWAHERIELRVSLSDLDQIIIKANKYCGYEFDPQTQNWKPKTDEIRKMKLTHLNYTLVDNEKGDYYIQLSQITGNFFNKGSNRVGIRSSWIQSPSKEVLDQIPDHFHSIAREYFANKLTPMLQSILSNGVVIGEKQNA